MPLTALRELTIPTQKALITSRDRKSFLARFFFWSSSSSFHYSIEVGCCGPHRSDMGRAPPPL
eukprot:3856205-Prymnesium_polylepis.1